MAKTPRIKVPAEVRQWSREGLKSAGGMDPVKHYIRCVRNGSSPKFAADLVALAVGKASMGTGVTDDVYIADQNRHGRSILDRMHGDRMAVERLRKSLAKNGYKLRDSDHYVETVARFQGDPEAIVNHGQGLGDLKRKLQKQGRTIAGEIEIKGEDTGPRKVKHKLHPRIVERIRRQKIAKQPELAARDQRALRHEIIEHHGSRSDTVD